MYTKYNHSGFADALRCEARGLALLAEHAGPDLHVPDVYAVDENRLVMTAVDAAPFSEAGWRKLGSALAALHAKPQPLFGLDHDNYIGLNPQCNRVSRGWGDFFVDFRLGFQVDLIRDHSIRAHYARCLQKHRTRLVDFLDCHCDFASLLHGDLWAGNVLCDVRGDVWLIDPAVYFGDREADLAMTEMFGGFGPAFYRAYCERLPLSPAYGHKKTLYNLYHYLNHYNLFGNSYSAGCEAGFALVEAL